METSVIVDSLPIKPQFTRVISWLFVTIGILYLLVALLYYRDNLPGACISCVAWAIAYMTGAWFW